MVHDPLFLSVHLGVQQSCISRIPNVKIMAKYILKLKVFHRQKYSWLNVHTDEFQDIILRGNCYLLFQWPRILALGLIFLRFYLFLSRGERRETERGKHQCVVTSHTHPTGDLAHNPGMCPDLGIKPVTLWFSGWHSIHWATPARASLIF